MAHIVNIEVKYGHADVLTAATGDYDNHILKIHAAHWVLAERVAKDYALNPAKAPKLTVTGTEQQPGWQFPGKAPGQPVPVGPFHKEMKLVKFTGHNDAFELHDA